MCVAPLLELQRHRSWKVVLIVSSSPTTSTPGRRPLVTTATVNEGGFRRLRVPRLEIDVGGSMPMRSFRHGGFPTSLQCHFQKSDVVWFPQPGCVLI